MATHPFVRWPQLDSVFAVALELEPAARPAFLDRACAGDVEFRQELEQLLAAADDPRSFLEDRQPLLASLAEAIGEPGPPPPSGPPVGDRVGVYRLVAEIGRGGMGVVYLAERADGDFEQRVALKLLGGWLGGATAVRRFQRERRILARLEHPNIARLLDGGVTEDGRPYFVMEHVDGTPIDRYCDEHHLEVPARLELFLQLCAAVELAHRNLIVHRDIKPGNALVTADGTPKLLDFGIARLLHDDERSTDPLTRTGMHPMTPEYASPEMVLGEPVGTASDVYQLGGLLYHLLTGRPPHRLRDGSLVEVERAVRAGVTARPSAVVGGGTGEGAPDLERARIAHARGTTPERLRRRLRGDLDTIVLTALRPEPERRYRSVEQLAEDVRRHLEGLPVRARPDTILYRSSKFVGRHRFGVASALLACVLLTGSGIVVARQRARTARENAKAEQVTRFLVDLFQRSDPNAGPGDTLGIRRVLGEGARRIRTELANEPDVRATLLGVIGGVYGNIGSYGEARDMLREAVAIRRGLPDPHRRGLQRSLAQLGQLYMEERDAPAAEPVFREALAIARADPDRPDSVMARALSDYAFALHLQGRLVAAESLYRASLGIYDGSHATGPPYRATLSNLGWIHLTRGEYGAADSAFGLVLPLARRARPPGHAEIADHLVALASLRVLQERYAEAEPLAREALATNRALYGKGHRLTADALQYLAGSLAGQRRTVEAESAYHAALAIYGGAIGERCECSSQVLTNLGVLLRDEGRLDEAEAATRQALALYRARFQDPHPNTARAAANLASVLLQRGRVGEADSLLRESERMLRDVGSGDVPPMPQILIMSGRAEMTADPAAAEIHLRRAVEILSRPPAAQQLSLARGRAALGECLLQLRRYPEAERLLMLSYDTLTGRLGPQHPETRQARAARVELERRTARVRPRPQPPGSRD